MIITTKNQIQKVDWQQRLEAFTPGNMGRTSAVAADDITVVKNKPLAGVDYNPVRKGNDVVNTLKGFAQMINVPLELYITEESNGIASKLEIVEQMGRSTLLRLL